MAGVNPRAAVAQQLLTAGLFYLLQRRHASRLHSSKKGLLITRSLILIGAERQINVAC